MGKLQLICANDEPRVFELNDGITYVGRSAINDLQILDKYVSREHLLLRKEANRYFVRDLGSKNGTFVNGDQMRSGTEVEVKEGTSIVIGLSVISLGEEASDQLLALIASIRSSKELGATDTAVSKKMRITVCET